MTQYQDCLAAQEKCSWHVEYWAGLSAASISHCVPVLKQYDGH